MNHGIEPVGRLILKPGKDKPIRRHHHWIFSGAVKSVDPYQDGDVVQVFSAQKELLGTAYVKHHASITGRMVSFGTASAEEAIEEAISRAIALREAFFDRKKTNAYRLIHAEGDSIPGLIVDQYDDTLVFQSATAGVDRLKPFIVEILEKKLHPAGIYEKSDSGARQEEKLSEIKGALSGKLKKEIQILENGLKFIVDIQEGQKTGFFLDQREMRQRIRELSKDKKVLNVFGYTGGFTVAALAGGAAQADTLDSSEAAILMAQKNVELNGFESEKNQFVVANAFEALRQQAPNHDIVILDPPAFAKRKTDVMNAGRGYKDINRLAIAGMPKGSLLLTCSCSYHIDARLFQMVIFEAAHEAGRRVRIIERHRQAPDHPINIYHPENDYLKSLLLYID